MSEHKYWFVKDNYPAKWLNKKSLEIINKLKNKTKK